MCNICCTVRRQSKINIAWSRGVQEDWPWKWMINVPKPVNVYPLGPKKREGGRATNKASNISPGKIYLKPPQKKQIAPWMVEGLKIQDARQIHRRPFQFSFKFLPFPPFPGGRTLYSQNKCFCIVYLKWLAHNLKNLYVVLRFGSVNFLKTQRDGTACWSWRKRSPLHWCAGTWAFDEANYRRL